MDERSGWTPFGGTISLLAQPTALLAGFVLLACHYSRNVIMAELIARARQGNYALLAAAPLVSGVILFAIFAVIHFMLSRRLGGREGAEGEPGYGAWIGLMMLYFLVTQLSSSIGPFALTRLGFDYALISYVMAVFFLVLRVAFFPVMVFLAAQAHDGAGTQFGEVMSFLTGRGAGWFGGYVLLCIVLAALPIAMMQGMGTAGKMPAGAGMLIAAIVTAFGQLLTILYAIAAYRAVREDGGENNTAMF